MGKEDDFDTAELVRFSGLTISRLYREWTKKEKITTGQKYLVDARGCRRLDRLIWADRKTTATQITSRYNRGQQKSISERTRHGTLEQMGYSSRRLPVCWTWLSNSQQSKLREKETSIFTRYWGQLMGVHALFQISQLPLLSHHQRQSSCNLLENPPRFSLFFQGSQGKPFKNTYYNGIYIWGREGHTQPCFSV